MLEHSSFIACQQRCVQLVLAMLARGPSYCAACTKAGLVLLQFVASTEDWRSLRATGLAHHPNVSVATYQAPYSESRLRETINGYRGSPLHAVLETFFNIRDFSDAMLTDRRLFCQVQVSFDSAKLSYNSWDIPLKYTMYAACRNLHVQPWAPFGDADCKHLRHTALIESWNLKDLACQHKDPDKWKAK